MSINDSNTDKCTDNSNTKSFKKPIPHGVNFWLQLDDDNVLTKLVERKLREMDQTTGRKASSDHPHVMGRFRPSWTDEKQTQQAGLFPTGVEYGKQTAYGEWRQSSAYVCNTYDDASLGSTGIANNSKKIRVEIHERTDDLVYEDGNAYSWPGGWETGQKYTGTAIKIQASYVSDISEIIAQATELIGAVVGDIDRVRYLMRKVIHETVRFSGLEVHHRHHLETQEATVETLRDSSRLVAFNNGNGKERAAVERGHYQIYAFSTDNFDSIGFDSTIEYKIGAKTRTAEVEEHYIKEYLHRNANQFNLNNPLAHPKLEVKARGSFPAPAFEAVQKHLTQILNAHVEWAGIRKDDLVADDHYRPNERDNISTCVPTNYKLQLKDYFQSDGLQKTVIGMLFHRKTMAIHDILYSIVKKAWNNQICYDRLKELTGASKSTIGTYISELEEKKIVSRKQSGGMFVRITEFAKEHIGGMLNKFRTEGEIQSDIEKRKAEREKARKEGAEVEELTDKTPSGIASEHAIRDGGSSMWQMLTETPIEAEDLTELLQQDRITEDDIAIRRKT